MPSEFEQVRMLMANIKAGMQAAYRKIDELEDQLKEKDRKIKELEAQK